MKKKDAQQRQYVAQNVYVSLPFRTGPRLECGAQLKIVEKKEDVLFSKSQNYHC